MHLGEVFLIRKLAFAFEIFLKSAIMWYFFESFSMFLVITYELISSLHTIFFKSVYELQLTKKLKECHYSLFWGKSFNLKKCTSLIL